MKLQIKGAFVILLLAAAFAIAVEPLTRLQAQPTSQALYPVYEKSANLAANATTQVFSGDGVLHSVCINDQGASSNTASIYDATSGTDNPIAVIDTVTATGCLVYDAAVDNGIRVIIATGTAANITVTYRDLR